MTSTLTPASTAHSAIMSNKKQFEVGDLVIVNNRGIHKSGNIIRINEYRMVVVFRNNPVGVCYILNTLRCSAAKNSNCHKITCVRKPRKGNAESRAIVAMLARRYRKEPRVIEKQTDMEFCRGLYTAYDLAKLMLK